jgi:hypothetical protein
MLALVAAVQRSSTPRSRRLARDRWLLKSDE